MPVMIHLKRSIPSPPVGGPKGPKPLTSQRSRARAWHSSASGLSALLPHQEQLDLAALAAREHVELVARGEHLAELAQQERHVARILLDGLAAERLHAALAAQARECARLDLVGAGRTGFFVDEPR